MRVSSFLAARRVLVEQPPVGRADAKLRQAVLVQHRHVLILDLDDVDVRDDVLRLLRVVAAARLGIEVADDLDVLLEIVDRHAEPARNLRDLVVLQQAQVLGDDLLGRRPLEAEMPDLQPEAFLQVARGDADRIERLHVLQRALDVGDRPVAHRGDLFDRRDEIAVVVEIADDRAADFLAASRPRSAATAATSGDPTATLPVESVFSIGGSSLTSAGVRER